MNDLKGIIKDVEKSSLVSDKVIKKVIEIIGQEKWNDIHNEESDICTTTGELIITLKGIVDLEHQIEQMKCCENCNNFQHRIDHRCNTKCKNLSEWRMKENG